MFQVHTRRPLDDTVDLFDEEDSPGVYTLDVLLLLLLWVGRTTRPDLIDFTVLKHKPQS